MVNKDEIKTRYREYVENYPENTALAFESEYDTSYPLQDRALGSNTFAGVFRNQLANESEYLFELDETVPSIDELQIELLPTVGTELMGALMVQVTHDHIAFWEKSLELLSSLQCENDDIMEMLTDLYESVYLLSTSSIQDDINVEQIPLKSDGIAAYLAYPLTEAVVKFVCQDYIHMDGKLKPCRCIRGLGDTIYGPPERGDSVDECSNLADLLYHLEMVVADSDLKRQLETGREYIGRLYDTDPNVVYGDVLGEFRNRSLHGESRAPSEFGVLLTLSGILICREYLLEQSETI